MELLEDNLIINAYIKVAIIPIINKVKFHYKAKISVMISKGDSFFLMAA